MGRRIIVTVDSDSCVESPCDWDGGWKLYSFSRRHTNFRHPDEFAGLGFRNKLRAGTAFVLDYYEHGGSAWSLNGEGEQCRWDTANVAGVLVWEGKPNDLAKGRDARERCARQFLEVYNDWANGVCFFVGVETVHGEELFSCGGFIGVDHARQTLKGEVFRAGDEVVFRGDCAWVCEDMDLPDGVEEVDEHDEDEDDGETWAVLATSVPSI